MDPLKQIIEDISLVRKDQKTDLEYLTERQEELINGINTANEQLAKLRREINSVNINVTVGGNEPTQKDEQDATTGLGESLFSSAVQGGVNNQPRAGSPGPGTEAPAEEKEALKPKEFYSWLKDRLAFFVGTWENQSARGNKNYPKELSLNEWVEQFNIYIESNK